MKSEKGVLAEAVARLKQQGLSQQAPQAVIEQTLRRLGKAASATEACEPAEHRRIFIGQHTIRLLLASAALIAIGFSIGRLSKQDPVNLENIGELLTPSVAAAIEPVIRDRLIDEMRRHYQVALAATYVKLKEELTEQYRDDLNRFALHTLAASNATTNRLLAEVIESIDTAQTEDLRRIAKALHQIEFNRIQDRTQLAAGLQTLASRTETELTRTRREFVQLLVHTRPEDLDIQPDSHRKD